MPPMRAVARIGVLESAAAGSAVHFSAVIAARISAPAPTVLATMSGPAESSLKNATSIESGDAAFTEAANDVSMARTAISAPTTLSDGPACTVTGTAII